MDFYFRLTVRNIFDICRLIPKWLFPEDRTMRLSLRYSISFLTHLPCIKLCFVHLFWHNLLFLPMLLDEMSQKVQCSNFCSWKTHYFGSPHEAFIKAMLFYHLPKHNNTRSTLLKLQLTINCSLNPTHLIPCTFMCHNYRFPGPRSKSIPIILTCRN